MDRGEESEPESESESESESEVDSNLGSDIDGSGEEEEGAEDDWTRSMTDSRRGRTSQSRASD